MQTNFKTPKLKTVRESLLIAHSKNIIDDKELLLLCDINHSTNLNLPYWGYESFDLDSWSEDECSEMRFVPVDTKNIVNILRLPDVFKCNSGAEFCRSFLHILQTLCLPMQISRSHVQICQIYPILQLCMISNAVLDFLFNNGSHLLRTFEQKQLSQ